ncbi:hypothetical protein FKM82_010202 [Ascaphus truei]
MRSCAGILPTQPYLQKAARGRRRTVVSRTQTGVEIKVRVFHFIASPLTPVTLGSHLASSHPAHMTLLTPCGAHAV